MPQKIVPLNLDELTTPTKAIILDGASHQMRELTLQEFIDNAAKRREMTKKDGEMSLEEQIEAMTGALDAGQITAIRAAM